MGWWLPLGEIGLRTVYSAALKSSSQLFWSPSDCYSILSFYWKTPRCEANQDKSLLFETCWWDTRFILRPTVSISDLCCTSFQYLTLVTQQVFTSTSASSKQTGDCSSLLVSKAIAKRFLVQHPLHDSFLPATASNLWQPLANQPGNKKSSLVTRGHLGGCRLIVRLMWLKLGWECDISINMVVEDLNEW